MNGKLKKNVSVVMFCCLVSCVSHSQVEPIESVISRGLDRAAEQAVLMAKDLEDKDGRLPKSIKDGKLETRNCYWWCSGFFPGELWYLYEYTQKPELKRYAELFIHPEAGAEAICGTVYESFGKSAVCDG